MESSALNLIVSAINEIAHNLKKEDRLKNLNWDSFQYAVVLTLENYRKEPKEIILQLQKEFIEDTISSVWFEKDGEKVTIFNYLSMEKSKLYNLFYVRCFCLYNYIEDETEKELFLNVMLKIPYIGLKKIRGDIIIEKEKEFCNDYFDHKEREKLWEEVEKNFVTFINRYESVYIPQPKIQYYDEIMRENERLKEAVFNFIKF